MASFYIFNFAFAHSLNEHSVVHIHGTRVFSNSSGEFVVRLGAPQTTDDGSLAIVEFVVKEQRRITANYSMSIASPKEKKRYFSLTAVSYASIIISLPAKADTSIKRVLSGRWKLVISVSIALNL